VRFRFQLGWAIGAGAALGALEIITALSEPGSPRLSGGDALVLLAWLAIPYGAAVWPAGLVAAWALPRVTRLCTRRAAFAGTATTLCLLGWLREVVRLRETGPTHIVLEIVVAAIAAASGAVAGALAAAPEPERAAPAGRAFGARRLMGAVALIAALAWTGNALWDFVSLVGPARASSAREGATAGTAAAGRPNILLISIDTLRADHLSSYGYTGSSTPNIDALAADGIRYAHASTTAAFTVPAHASMMTGLFPSTHGATYQHEDPAAFAIRGMNSSYPTMAEILSERGYDTAAFVSCSLTGHAFGFARGFDLFDDRIDRLGSARELVYSRTMAFRILSSAGVFTRDDLDAERRADEVTPLAQTWLRAHGDDRPFFLFVHYYDPHAPYAPPPPYDRRADGSTIKPVYQGKLLLQGGYTLTPAALDDTLTLYDGEIRYVDHYLGDLLRTLEETGEIDHTLIILVGDHGESFGEHDHWAHTRVLYEDVASVPFIMRLPGRRAAGTVVTDVIAQPTDILPTALSVAGLKTEARFEGRDLTAWLEPRTERAAAALSPQAPRAPGGPRVAFAEQPRSDDSVRRYGNRWDRDLATARTLRWKYIHASNGVEELYDLLDDAGETENLADRDTDALETMRRLEAAWRRALAIADGEAPSDAVDEGTREKLRSLGYVQ